MLQERFTQEEKAAIRENQRNSMETVLGDLPDEARPNARIVGKWLWVEFQGKPDSVVRDCLIMIGFRWNPARYAWQHSCGNGRTRKAPYDPKEKYGEVAVEA